MRVICIRNNVTTITDSEVRERIHRSIHLDGPIADLVVGREYKVQAIEERDSGLWLYLHTVAVNDYPFPYPAEMFEFSDNTLPTGWSIRWQVQRGNVGWKRITFVAWATDDHFYERLIDGDTESVSLYRRWMVS